MRKISHSTRCFVWLFDRASAETKGSIVWSLGNHYCYQSARVVAWSTSLQNGLPLVHFDIPLFVGSFLDCVCVQQALFDFCIVSCFSRVSLFRFVGLSLRLVSQVRKQMSFAGSFWSLSQAPKGEEIPVLSSRPSPSSYLEGVKQLTVSNALVSLLLMHCILPVLVSGLRLYQNKRPVAVHIFIVPPSLFSSSSLTTYPSAIPGFTSNDVTDRYRHRQLPPPPDLTDHTPVLGLGIWSWRWASSPPGKACPRISWAKLDGDKLWLLSMARLPRREIRLGWAGQPRLWGNNKKASDGGRERVEKRGKRGRKRR